jgi:hypothetical protein
MKRQTPGHLLSAVFVDYDNIYLSLKRKNEEAAKRFAKDAGAWIREIESGRLLTPTNAPFAPGERRIVLNRCYGNPVPRRNQNDNTTDMNSFPFVRHHFLRAGFEIVDCPPLTAQLKNSSDIRMVMDVRDYIDHETYFDEFVILSGDADFTPVLHRLRAHARRTIVYANDYTAAPYTAIADGEVREADLIALLGDGKSGTAIREDFGAAPAAMGGSPRTDDVRREIVAEIIATVKAAAAPVPLEVLAERAMRALGHEKTVGSNWAGAGSFRELLVQTLPQDIRLTDQPPYLAYDARRGLPIEAQAAAAQRPVNAGIALKPAPAAPLNETTIIPQHAVAGMRPAFPMRPSQPDPVIEPPMSAPRHMMPETAPKPAAAQRAPELQAPATTRQVDNAAQMQQSITRIYDACQAPPLSPHDYRVLFSVMVQEINENHLQGAQTLTNIIARAKEAGVEVRRDDVRFVLEVVSEADPWFEQGATVHLFAGRFRNFVVARCRSQGLNLSSDELDMVDAWFAGNGQSQMPAQRPAQAQPQAQSHVYGGAQPAAGSVRQQAPLPSVPVPDPRRGDRWWGPEDGRQRSAELPGEARPAAGVGGGLPRQQVGAEGGFGAAADEFPRIVRTRLRG